MLCDAADMLTCMQVLASGHMHVPCASNAAEYEDHGAACLSCDMARVTDSLLPRDYSP